MDYAVFSRVDSVLFDQLQQEETDRRRKACQPTMSRIAHDTDINAIYFQHYLFLVFALLQRKF